MSKILNDTNDGGVTRTKIMCRASLSYFQLKRYLIVLTQNELISYDSNTGKFKTTEKGFRFLEAYDQINSMMNAQPTTNLDIVAEEEESKSYRGISTWI
jgi:predicted transcriptional regulator